MPPLKGSSDVPPLNGSVGVLVVPPPPPLDEWLDIVSAVIELERLLLPALLDSLLLLLRLLATLADESELTRDGRAVVLMMS